MPNMKTIITGHNKKLLEKKSSQQSKPWNCKNKDICPLKGSCRQKSVIYQADISFTTHLTCLPSPSNECRSLYLHLLYLELFFLV